MTDAAFAREAFWLAMGVAAILLVYRYVWVPACVDAFRQDVFELRHELFLLMAAERLAPTSREYTNLRTMMNGWLRFAERATFVRALVGTAVLGSLARRAPYEDILRMSHLDRETKERLGDIHHRMMRRLLILVLQRSLLLVVALSAASIVGAGASLARAVYSGILSAIGDEAFEDAELHSHHTPRATSAA